MSSNVFQTYFRYEKDSFIPLMELYAFYQQKSQESQEQPLEPLLFVRRLLQECPFVTIVIKRAGKFCYRGALHLAIER